jgi:hypothetical protein
LSKDSSVRIVSRLWAEWLGFNTCQRQGILLFATASRPVMVPTQPPVQWVLGALSWGGGVKKPVHEADHSPPSSVEVKNAWSYMSTAPYIFMAWCLVKHKICLHGVVLSWAQGQLYLT